MELAECFPIIRFVIHYGLHFLMPGMLAYCFFRNEFKKAWLIMIVTMLVDVDHLLVTPIFDPNRCSIGFHFLHSYIAIGCYFLLLAAPRCRIVAVGLLFHMFTDYLDCILLKF